MGERLTVEQERTYRGLSAAVDRNGPIARRQLAGGTDIGMSDKDLRDYSLVRAIRAASGRNWHGAELEHEASSATARVLGRDPQGFFVPNDWQKRDLVKGTPEAGGHLVGTELLAGSFIELLRSKTVLKQAGATYLPGLVGDVQIARQTGAATAYWIGEGGAPTESQQEVDQVELTPHTVGAFTDISRKLLNQSTPAVEGLVRRDLAAVLARAVDRAGLHGTGESDEPVGIANTDAIGSVTGGTNGEAPTWAHIIALETEVAQDDADVGALGYLTNTKVRGKLKQTFRNVTYGELPVWGEGDTPLNGYAAHVTNQVASNLVKGGSGAVCSAIFFGNWADLLIGLWGVLDIMVDPYTHSTSGTERVVALYDVDVAVRHPESFAVMLDALTT